MRICRAVSLYCPALPTYTARMKIVLNGEPYELPEPATIAELLARIQQQPRLFAVERNHELVPRQQYTATAVQEGDRIEIATFVGGG